MESQEEPIDVQIQRLVFGATDVRFRPAYEDDGYIVVLGTDGGPDNWKRWCYMPPDQPADSADCFCKPIPAYSTDIAAAFKVVDEIEKRGFRWSAWSDGEFYMSKSGPDDEDPAVFEGKEETLPLAICKAALEAVKS